MQTYEERAAEPYYHEKNIHYWTKRAPGYSDVNREELATQQKRVWRQTLTRYIDRHFAGRRREDIHILDVGTGPGFFAILLAECGYDVTAVDYTQAMLREARSNAGAIGDRIRFCEMNAEDLAFEDVFDVIVSRNVTWNLCHPERAYENWVGALKEGGLLLNFDANWYHFLYDDEALERHIQDRENVKRSEAIRDDNAGTDVDAMLAIAKKAPLSAQDRPAWDKDKLEGLGMQVMTDTEIWRRVWTLEETVNNASTPMFLIHAVKGAVCSGFMMGGGSH